MIKELARCYSEKVTPQPQPFRLPPAAGDLGKALRIIDDIQRRPHYFAPDFESLMRPDQEVNDEPEEINE